MLGTQKDDSFVEKKLTETAYRTHNFNTVPPIIGIIVSDQYGNNIQNLSRLEIYGSNIKAQIYFLFEYMVIVFLNSQTNLTSKERAQVLKYCEDKLTKYKYEFENFNDARSRDVLRILESKGKNWLKKFNVKYIQTYKNIYLRKHETIEKSMNEIGLIIQNELYAYLEYIPDEIINNITKEIRNKIQDKLFDFDLNVSEKK